MSLHFNLKMKTKQSLPYKSQLFFAPYPISLTFSASRAACFTVKLQRNLMPIAAFDTLPTSIHEPQIKHFAIPSPPQAYQLRSLKDVNFQWSLHLHNKEKAQQFVEMRRVSLATQLLDYESNSSSVFELQQEFNNVKCRLKYLVCFADSEAGLELLVQRYTLQSSKEGVVGANQQRKKEESIDDGKLKQERSKKTSHTEQDDPKSQTNDHEDHPTLCRFTSLQQACPDSSPILIDTNDPQPQRLLKLSKSQLQICQHIEYQINEYQRKKQESQRSSHQKYYGSELLDTRHNSAIAMVQSQLIINKQNGVASGLGKWLVLMLVALLVLAAGWKVTHLPYLGGIRPGQLRQTSKKTARKSQRSKGEVYSKPMTKRRR